MSNNFTTLLKRKADEPTSSPEKVTAEQQARMEQNRKLALERLKQRKLAIESSPSASTPASTSTSLVPSTSTTLCTNVRSSTEIMKSPVKKGRTRHPLEYKLSLLSSRCKSWHYLFRFGCEFGLNVLQFLDLASCCLARSVSSSFRELAMKVEHQRIDFFSLTRKRPKKRGKVTGEVLGRILSYPGCQEVKRLSIKGCVKITGEDLRNVLKSPACKLARLIEFDHTGCHESLQGFPFFTYRPDGSLVVKNETSCLCEFAGCGRRVCVPDYHIKHRDCCRECPQCHRLVCQLHSPSAEKLCVQCDKFAVERQRLDAVKAQDEQELLKAAAEGNTPKVTALIGLNVNVKCLGPDNASPLDVAIRRGHEKVALLLIEAQADINRVNEFGFTPLRYAILKERNKVYEALVSRGAICTCKLHKASHQHALGGAMVPLPRNVTVTPTGLMVAKQKKGSVPHLSPTAPIASSEAPDLPSSPFKSSAQRTLDSFF